MKKSMTTRKRLLPALLAAGCLVISGGVLWSVLAVGPHRNAALAATGESTASVSGITTQLGPSGLPLPRFVSLKTEKVNVRKGPSSDHDVAWVFQRKGLPVEIVAEFETWRRVRDSDGSEGWILQNMLGGKRTGLVAPWRKGQSTALLSGANRDSSVVAELDSGAQVDIRNCDGNWCQVLASGYRGYVDQGLLWGAYPGEVVN